MQLQFSKPQFSGFFAFNKDLPDGARRQFDADVNKQFGPVPFLSYPGSGVPRNVLTVPNEADEFTRSFLQGQNVQILREAPLSEATNAEYKRLYPNGSVDMKNVSELRAFSAALGDEQQAFLRGL